MNDRMKVAAGVSGVAAAGYGLGRGAEWLVKKIIAKVKEKKAKKEEK